MKEADKETQQPIPVKNKWFAGYVVAGLIWTFSQNLDKNTIDDLIILAVAVLAGVFYHRLKSRIRIKNDVSKAIVTFIILSVISAFLIGTLTVFANNWEALSIRTPFGTEIVTRDRDSLVQLNQNQKKYLADFQTRWEATQNSIDDKTESRTGYIHNIVAYKTLQKLNTERQDKVTQYFNQASPILVRYSKKLADAFSQLLKTDDEAKTVYNDIFTAKIKYYQALIKNQSEAEISTKATIVNNAIGKVSRVVQAGKKAQENYQKIYNEVFGS